MWVDFSSRGIGDSVEKASAKPVNPVPPTAPRQPWAALAPPGEAIPGKVLLSIHEGVKNL